MKVIVFLSLVALVVSAPIALNDESESSPLMDSDRLDEMRKHFCGNTTDEDCEAKIKQHIQQVRLCYVTFAKLKEM